MADAPSEWPAILLSRSDICARCTCEPSGSWPLNQKSKINNQQRPSAQSAIVKAKPVSPETIAAKEAKSRRKAGLAHWMRRVLKECDKAAPDLAADPVHDLRVAMRRCRSMADGLRVIDPDKSWKQLKKSSKPLFQSLGDLRDVQVMMDWINLLGSPDDPTTQALHTFIKNRETVLKKEALQALQQFDRKQWKIWCRDLPRRAARIRLGSLVFKHLALERWTEARKLQPSALRTQSPNTLHRLRIGLKRFRYTVENFLPQLDARWSDDLKDLQDTLGEVHDLDVLWSTALTIQAFPDQDTRARWHQSISQERKKRIEKYKEKMTGPHSLWSAWRAELPQGPQIHAAALSRLKVWASFLDPNFQHAQRVADLAAIFYDDLARNGFQPRHANHNARSILYAAAFMHDVGRARKEKNHHKKSSNLIRKLTPPLGFSAEELNLAAAIARYHRGTLPQSRHKVFRSLPRDQRPTAIHLAAILRLVDALARADNRIRSSHEIESLQVKNGPAALRVYAPNFLPRTPAAEKIAAARYLLELTLRRPIIVQRLRKAGNRSLPKRRTANPTAA